jgi:Exonuclease
VFTLTNPWFGSVAGKYVALDCEMVGVGKDGLCSALARVSIVNYHGHLLYDTYVKPMERIVDYRSEITGIYSRHLQAGKRGRNSMFLNRIQMYV